MSEKIKIMIVDDHSIVRMGLKSLLSTKENFEVVGEAINGENAVNKAMKLEPDVIIMDLVMPKLDGVGATKKILEKCTTKPPKILILTTFGTSEEISQALEAGAIGAIMKSAANSELITAIGKVAKGHRYVASDIEQMLAVDPPVNELSPRQLAILESITRGLTNKEIAAQLEISPESVKTHIARLFEKIGAASRSEAASIALKKHLIKR